MSEGFTADWLRGHLAKRSTAVKSAEAVQNRPRKYRNQQSNFRA
jgi:hypothetical protein